MALLLVGSLRLAAIIGKIQIAANTMHKSLPAGKHSTVTTRVQDRANGVTDLT